MEKALFFWSDRWLHDHSLQELAPNVLKCVPSKFRKTRSVAAALTDLTWVSDIKGALSWLGLTEYLDLWDALSGFVLNPTEDIHHWKPESSGIFSTKSAYPFSSAPSPLKHGSDYGSLGLRGNAKLSYGWPFGTVVGRQTD